MLLGTFRTSLTMTEEQIAQLTFAEQQVATTQPRVDFNKLLDIEVVAMAQQMNPGAPMFCDAIVSAKAFTRRLDRLPLNEAMMGDILEMLAQDQLSIRERVAYMQQIIDQDTQTPLEMCLLGSLFESLAAVPQSELVSALRQYDDRNMLGH